MDILLVLIFIGWRASYLREICESLVRCSAVHEGEFSAVECSAGESLAKVRASPFSSTLNIILGLATHCTAELQSHFVCSVIPQQHLEKVPLKECARAGWCERWPSLPKPLPFPNRAARNSQNHQVAEDLAGKMCFQGKFLLLCG